LPALAYLADVPVQASYHGSALIYRLLRDYPADRLLILEAAPWRSQEALRLKTVPYRSFPIGWGRLLNSRFSRLYGSWVLARSPRRWRVVRLILKPFKADAVLTVAHGYSWLTAAEFAFRENLPLHLILHDDWLSSVQVLPSRKASAEQMFARYYNFATSRLCVSPAMAKRYCDRYGPAAQVLYPIRAPDAPVASGSVSPPARSGVVVGYAGTINGAGYIDRLKALATILEQMGGSLVIYGPMMADRAEEVGLNRDNVVFRGLVSSQELIVRLRVDADFLFVPMSFRHEDRTNMELSFPSKLTDYTAVGLPLLINGPPYCSAIRWGKENPGAAALVDKEDDRALAEALKGLAQQKNRMRELGEGALVAGERCFSYTALSRQFETALRAKSINQTSR